MSNPSNLKVKRLVELPALPGDLYPEAQGYAVVDSADYKFEMQGFAEAAADSVIAQIQEDLATVAFTGDYGDLINTPSIPQDTDELDEGVVNLYMTPTEKTKLDGIADGAQVNTVSSVNSQTGAVELDAGDVGAEPAFAKGSIVQGSGVILTGTLANRLVGTGDVTVAAVGGGGSGVLEIDAGTGIDVDSTDPEVPVVSLSAGAQASLALADSAVQNLAGLGITASAAEINHTTGVTSAIQTQLNAKQATLSSSTSNTISGNEVQRAALIGDVTASANSNTTAIANTAVSNAKMANMATQTIKGRTAAGTGSPEDLTAAQVRTLLNVANGATANTGTVNSVAVADATGISWAGSPITTGGTFTPTLSTNLQSWSGIAPSAKADDNAVWKLSGNQTSSGTKTIEDTSAIKLVLSRTGTTVSAVTEVKTTAGSIYYGYGAANMWAVGSDPALHTGANRWLTVEATAASVPGTFSCAGASLGTTLATGADLSSHLRLYSNNFGLNVVSGRIQCVFNGAVVWYTTGSTFEMTGSVNATAALSAGTSVTAATSVTAGTTVSDSLGNVRDVSVLANPGTINLAQAHRGRALTKTNNTAQTVTVQPNSSVAVAVNTAVTFMNMGGTTNNMVVARGSGVAIYRNGTNANITLAPGESVTLLKLATDTWQA